MIKHGNCFYEADQHKYKIVLLESHKTYADIVAVKLLDSEFSIVFPDDRSLTIPTVII